MGFLLEYKRFSMSETYEQTLDDIKNWLEKKKK